MFGDGSTQSSPDCAITLASDVPMPRRGMDSVTVANLSQRGQRAREFISLGSAENLSDAPRARVQPRAGADLI